MNKANRELNLEIRQKIMKLLRWVYLCWMWMFIVLALSPMFGTFSNIGQLTIPLVLLNLSLIFLPQMMRSIPSSALALLHMIFWIWISVFLHPNASILFQMVGIPVLLSEESILRQRRFVPCASILLSLYILFGSGNFVNLLLRLESLIVTWGLVVLATNNVYRRFYQAAEL